MTDRTCTTEGCDRKHHAKSLCLSHYRQAWRLADVDRVRAKNREWHHANRAEANARAAERYQLEREARIARATAWRAANPERHAMNNRAIQARRRALQRSSGEHVDYRAILAEHGMVCHLCGGDIQPGDLHFDHVIPLALGGPHVTENIRPAHARCNLRKGARLIA